MVTATGIRDALAPFAPLLLDSDAMLVNMGADDEFGPDVPPDRAVNEKRPVNFLLREPTSTRYIDPTLALHSAGILELMRASAASGIGDLDLDGMPRYSGGVADKGCFEYDKSQFSIGIS